MLRRGFLAALAVLSYQIAACNTTNRAVSTDKSFVSVAKKWASPNIPVCWEAIAKPNATERGWVKAAITKAFSVSNVAFTGWKMCADDSDAAQNGVHISVVNDENAPFTNGLGSELAGVADGMVLKFHFTKWSPECEATRKSCIGTVSVHEFGHAAGLDHEQDRTDAPADCAKQADTDTSDVADTQVGPYDPHSIMNYCNPTWNNDGVLTQGDIDGLNVLYPPAAAGT